MPRRSLLRIPLRGWVLVVVGMLGLTAYGASLGGNNGGGGSNGEQKLTIGYVTPQTGALAAFGEADKFVVDQMNGYFNDHPIRPEGSPTRSTSSSRTRVRFPSGRRSDL